MPRFSIITPVYNPPPEAFAHCIRTVLNQSFGDWEWCLANDASPDAWVAPRLHELQRQDPRIRVVERATNGGIVAASNDAIAISSGEFLVLLDNDDELHLDALQLVADAINGEPECDYAYSDENKITSDGLHFDAFLKPAWSPERLLAQNYTSHLSVLRRSLVDAVGRFRSGFDGSQDYDLVLRVIEQARKVVHVPHVLYHWRSLPTSTASAASAKPYAFVAALKAVREHLERTSVAADVTEAGPSLARVRRLVDNHPEVSIVLPIDERRQRILGVETSLATNVIRSLVHRTSYNNFTLVLVVPEHVSDAYISLLTDGLRQTVTVVRVADDQNISQQLNAGLVACTTRLAVLLDQHCEFVESDWLETLLGYQAHADVAMVAPLIVDVNGSIVSAGLAMSPTPHEIAQGRRQTDLGPVGMFGIARECFGVSARCALVDVATLKRVGAFSPSYSTRIRDFDLACKLHEIDLHAIVTPLATVRSFEQNESRESLDDDLSMFSKRWGHLYEGDPFTRIDTRLPLQPKEQVADLNSHHGVDV